MDRIRNNMCRQQLMHGSRHNKIEEGQCLDIYYYVSIMEGQITKKDYIQKCRGCEKKKLDRHLVERNFVILN